MFYKHIRSKAIGAHRGASAVALENSMQALRKAYGHCDFVELDMQLSSDGVAVIFHDEDLLRLSNIATVYPKDQKRALSEFSFEALQKLSFGNSLGVQSSLLTLEESFAFAKERGLALNIEIKDLSKSFQDRVVVETLVEAVYKYKMQEYVLISSFYSPYLQLLKHLAAELPTALLVEKQHPQNLAIFLEELGVKGYHMEESLVEKECIDLLKKHQFFVGVYTVNDKQKAQDLFAMGVDLLFSDNLEIFI